MRRIGSIILGIMAVIAFVALLGVQFFHVSRNALDVPKGVAQPHFTLTGTDGKTVSEADFRGKYLIIYFGYIFCPDVCPTNLSAIAEGLDKLGAKADNVVPIFISVDPARDTPDKLKDYVAQFSPRMIGLTGSPEQVQKAAEQFGVFYARGPGEGDAYSVDHSAFTYIVGPDGVRLDTLAHGFSPERLVDLLSQKIGNPASP